MLIFIIIKIQSTKKRLHIFIRYHIVCHLGTSTNPNIFEWNDYVPLNNFLVDSICEFSEMFGLK